MELHKLPKITTRRSKVLGRGSSSGRGKTAGRGTKGQKARGKMPLFFEGGALPLIKRLPYLRGRGRNKAFAARPVTVKLTSLNKLPSRSVVSVDSLVAHSIVPIFAKKTGVKILGNGRIEKALKVKVLASAGAQREIKRAGGTVELEDV